MIVKKDKKRQNIKEKQQKVTNNGQTFMTLLSKINLHGQVDKSR